MSLNGIWLYFRLKEVSIESKNAQIRVRTKKLWLIEVWRNFGCRGSVKFRNPCEIFSQGLQNFATPTKIFASLQNIPAFSIFVFFSSFSCLIHLKTITKHSNQSICGS